MSMIAAGALPLFVINLVFAQSAQVTPLFKHAPHKSITCISCHESEDGHGAVKISTAANCSGCHHSQANAKQCTSCHVASRISGTYTKTVEFRIANAKPVARQLRFDHARHAKDDCTMCHTPSRKMGVSKSCGSCHEKHHTELRNCTSCHTQTQPIKAHTRKVHVTCSGAGCHQTTVKTTALRTQRNVCLTCHTDKVKHEPAGDCASCHMIPNKSMNARAAR